MKRIEDVTFPWERNLTYAQRASWLSNYRRELLKKQTPAEIAFHRILSDLGMRYIAQKGFMMPPRFAIVDFYLPKPYKICIEIDGLGHREYGQAYRDSMRDVYLRRRGYRVLRFTNYEVLHQPEKVKAELVHSGKTREAGDESRLLSR